MPEKSDTIDAVHVPWWRKLLAWLKAYWYIPASFAAFFVAWLLAKMAGTHSGSMDALYAEAKLEQRLDASRKAADKEIAAVRERTEENIQRVEAEHAASLAALEDAQADEYREVRKGGPKAAASWINRNLDRRGL